MSKHVRVKEQRPSSHCHSVLSNLQVVQRTPIGATLYQRAHSEPRSLSHAEVQVLQRTLGNRAVTQLLQGTARKAGQAPLQNAALPQPQASTAGLPAPLKAGVENLSGLSMDDVQVHYNSSRPAEVQALAYTQGTDIHVGPGQEKHLAHEAWHVVQQKQGRVTPTIQARGQEINDDQGLEQEADSMGKKVASAVNVTQVSHVKETEDVTGHAKKMLVPKTIQRLGPNWVASDLGLINEYYNLLRSAEFQKLNQIVTQHQDITLLDSSANQALDYNPATHTIRVPLNTPAGAARSLPDVREMILWEMHNARNRGAHKRTALKFPVPGPNATWEEKELFLDPYNLAARALSKEWDEWIKVAEHDIRADAINQDPAVTGPLGANPVTRRFGGNLAEPGEKWYQFKEYLRDQIANNHTTSYDKSAPNADWEGHRILATVQRKSPASLIMTNKQVDDFIEGKKTYIKDEAINPFKNRAIIKEASFGDY